MDSLATETDGQRLKLGGRVANKDGLWYNSSIAGIHWSLIYLSKEVRDDLGRITYEMCSAQTCTPKSEGCYDPFAVTCDMAHMQWFLVDIKHAVIVCKLM